MTVAVAVGAALLLSAYAGLLVLIRGDAAFRKYPHVNLRDLVMLYLGGAFVVGTIAGVLLPLARKPVGAILLGILSALPLYTAAVALLQGPISRWRPLEYKVVILLSATVGGAVGYLLWEKYESRVPEHRDKPRKKVFNSWHSR